MTEDENRFELELKRLKEREAEIDRFITEHGEVCLQAPYGRLPDQFVVVHPCTFPGKGEYWQASFFDDRGASGHTLDYYKSLIELLVFQYYLDLSKITRVEKPPGRESHQVESQD